MTNRTLDELDTIVTRLCVRMRAAGRRGDDDVGRGAQVRAEVDRQVLRGTALLEAIRAGNGIEVLCTRLQDAASAEAQRNAVLNRLPRFAVDDLDESARNRLLRVVAVLRDSGVPANDLRLQLLDRSARRERAAYVRECATALLRNPASAARLAICSELLRHVRVDLACAAAGLPNAREPEIAIVLKELEALAASPGGAPSVGAALVRLRQLGARDMRSPIVRLRVNRWYQGRFPFTPAARKGGGELPPRWDSGEDVRQHLGHLSQQLQDFARQHATGVNLYRFAPWGVMDDAGRVESRLAALAEWAPAITDVRLLIDRSSAVVQRHQASRHLLGLADPGVPREGECELQVLMGDVDVRMPLPLFPRAAKRIFILRPGRSPYYLGTGFRWQVEFDRVLRGILYQPSATRMPESPRRGIR